jgi:hypothetical protein
MRDGESHPPAALAVDARHRRQIAHVDLRRDPARAHQLLDRFRQQLHQRQPALHLLKQPALLQRRLRFAHPQRPLQHQRVGLAHCPHHGLDRVAAQLLKRGDALVAVDDQIAVWLSSGTAVGTSCPLTVSL